ncbi:TPA: hypothetical protein ACH3X3_005099 [Trebouxia sp. C0006]
MMQAIKVCRQGYQYVPSHRVNPSRHQLWCTTTPESVFSRALCSTGVCHQPERGITTPLVSIPQPTNFSHEVACEARIPVTGELIGCVIVVNLSANATIAVLPGYVSGRAVMRSIILTLPISLKD